MALGGSRINPGLGKGGAIFIVTEDLAQQAGVTEVAQVFTKVSFPRFQGNIAQNTANSPLDNRNVFGLINLAI